MDVVSLLDKGVAKGSGVHPEPGQREAVQGSRNYGWRRLARSPPMSAASLGTPEKA